MIRLENILKISLQEVLKTSSKRLEDVFERRLEDVLKTFLRRLEDVLETSWRRIAKTNILVLTKMSWKRLEDVLWRRMTKANIFVLIKTSWRRLHQDECLVGHYFLLIYPEKDFARSFKASFGRSNRDAFLKYEGKIHEERYVKLFFVNLQVGISQLH